MRYKIFLVVFVLVFSLISAYGQSDGVYLKQRIKGEIVYIDVNNPNKKLIESCSPRNLDKKVIGKVYPTILKSGELINIDYQDEVQAYRLISIDGKILNESKHLGKEALDIKAPTDYKGVMILQLYIGATIKTHKLIVL